MFHNRAVEATTHGPKTRQNNQKQKSCHALHTKQTAAAPLFSSSKCEPHVPPPAPRQKGSGRYQAAASPWLKHSTTSCIAMVKTSCLQPIGPLIRNPHGPRNPHIETLTIVHIHTNSARLSPTTSTNETDHLLFTLSVYFIGNIIGFGTSYDTM